MKKRYVGALIMAAILVVTGCDLLGTNDTASGPSAPDMGSPSALPASGGTVPGTDTEAKTLFLQAFSTFGTGLATADSSGSVSPQILSKNIKSLEMAANKNILARATESQTTPLDYTLTIGGGTITITGSMTTSVTSPDESFEPQPNHTYNDIFKFAITGNEIEAISNVTLPESGAPTYTYNGKVVSNVQINYNMDVVTDSNGYLTSMDMDLAMGVQAGFAISVKRSDGAGAKFILSYAFNYSKNNINMMSESDLSDLQTALESKQATLKVYDDNNELKYSISLSLDEINMVDPTDFMN
ncbi:MAG: hypothetical protein AB1404_05360 [Spirochaetota bacterium]|jgi:hypothetical protein